MENLNIYTWFNNNGALIFLFPFYLLMLFKTGVFSIRQKV